VLADQRTDEEYFQPLLSTEPWDRQTIELEKIGSWDLGSWDMQTRELMKNSSKYFPLENFGTDRQENC
jgi:hypothetical protein